MKKHIGPVVKKTIAAAFTVGSIALFGASAASAHAHSMSTGNDKCVLLAQNGGEGDVTLPHADSFDVGKQHPLHVNVHLGAPGRANQIGVVGKDSVLCPNGYVND